MKRWIAMLLAVIMMGTLSGAFAGTEAESQQEQAAMFSTIAQAMEEAEYTGYSSLAADAYVMIVEKDGRYIRVVSRLDDATAQKVSEIYQIEDYEEMDRQLNELTDTLAVAYTEDFTDSLMGQEELDALAGKTVGALLEEGAAVNSHGYGGEGDDAIVTVGLDIGLFSYEFVVDATVEEYEERSETEDFGDWIIQSGRLEGLSGNATDLDYHADGTYEPSETYDDDVTFGGEVLSALMEGFANVLAGAEGVEVKPEG